MASGRAGTRTVPLSQGHPPRPTTRWDFNIAIICALPLEVDAVTALFDHHWEENGPSYGRAVGDSNAYSTGAIGLHNVVLVHMRGMGKVEAATVATGCRSSFPNIRLAMVVGVCGAAPFTPAGQEIVLGDVTIGEGVVQYDFGRRLPESFIRKDTLQESLGRHRAEIGGQLARLKSERGRTTLERKMAGYLVAIQSKTHSAIQYPGTEHDRLFQAAYRHVADGKLCNECGCDGPLVRRNRLEQDSTQPIVHIGLVASGDTVLKSGEDRDTVAQKEGVIGFEMEGAGVWDVFPCVVIKGVCDYADSHKMKAWQQYAAATAAACMKAFLESWPPSTSYSASQYHIPLLRNRKFTGRDAILKELQQKLFIEKECQKLAVVGLGGVGKTQLALQLTYWVKDNQPDYSIFWVPVLSHAGFEQAYLEIGKKLGIPMNIDEEDPKESVRRYLSSDEAGRWLLIIDNADDLEMVLGSNDGTEGIDQYLPESDNGLTLFTTRSIEVGQSVAGSDVVELYEMNPSEAIGLLEKSLLRKHLIQDKAIAIELLQKLELLPLAITQAAAYLNCNRQVTVRRYLELLRGTERDRVGLISREFKDATRYRGSKNTVATTWLVSFDKIQNIDNRAANLLSFLSCIEPKAIPRSLFPDTESEETENAIGTLCGYAFLAVREDEELYDMHSLVHLATKVWIRKAARTEETTVQALRHFEATFPSSDRANRLVWQAYLPHAFRLLDGSGECRVDERFDLFYQAGKCLYADRRFKDAVRCHKEVVRWKSDTLPDTDDDRLLSEHWLAITYLDDRRIPEAIEMLEHVVAVRKETLDERDYERLTSEHNLASAYLSDRRIPEAIEMLKHVVAVEKETLDERDHSRLVSEHELAMAYLEGRRIPEAIEILEHVVAVRKETLDERDHERLTSEHELATAYLSDRRIPEAIKMFKHVVAVQKETLDERDHNRLVSKHELVSAYLSDWQIPKAIEMLEHVVAVEKETLDERDHSRLASEHELARAYLDARRIPEAIKLLEHVVAIEEGLLREDDPDRMVPKDLLEEAYKMMSDGSPGSSSRCYM